MDRVASRIPYQVQKGRETQPCYMSTKALQGKEREEAWTPASQLLRAAPEALGLCIACCPSSTHTI